MAAGGPLSQRQLGSISALPHTRRHLLARADNSQDRPPLHQSGKTANENSITRQTLGYNSMAIGQPTTCDDLLTILAGKLAAQLLWVVIDRPGAHTKMKQQCAATRKEVQFRQDLAPIDSPLLI